MRDDEDIKLLADVIEPLIAAAPAPAPREERTEAQIAKDAPVKLYLRLERREMAAVQALLNLMPGEVPVYMHLPQEGITLLCPRSLWARDAEEAAGTLAPEIGEENIKVVRKA